MNNELITKTADMTDGVQMTAHITVGNKSQNNFRINFPTTAEKLYEELKTGNLSDCKINDVTCEVIPLLTHYVGYQGNDTTINELQYISTLISKLTPDECETLSAFLEMQFTDENITAKHIMDALENLNTVNLDTTIKTVEDIGNQWLNEAKEGCQPAIDRLSASTNQSDINFLNFVQLLNENFDIASYGQKLCEVNDMYPTSKGVINIDWSAFFWREDRQVPDEMKLPEKAKPSILQQVEENKNKLAQTDRQGKQKKKQATGIDD